MRKQERWNKIVDIIYERNEVNVMDLTVLLKSSESTIRRDLNQMAELNIINRQHGGAILNTQQSSELPMKIKLNSNQSDKKEIARIAARQIKDNQMIYLDAGSSTYEMIDFITAKNITVVTIGIPHIIKLGENKINTIVLGGHLHWSTEAITGNQTLNQIRNLYFDIAFLGVNGIHKQIGLTTSNEQEAFVKSEAIKQSQKTFILADESKFDRLNPVKFADLEETVIITNKDTKDIIKYNIINK